jgi:hypothetical protein
MILGFKTVVFFLLRLNLHSPAVKGELVLRDMINLDIEN